MTNQNKNSSVELEKERVNSMISNSQSVPPVEKNLSKTSTDKPSENSMLEKVSWEKLFEIVKKGSSEQFKNYLLGIEKSTKQEALTEVKKMIEVVKEKHFHDMEDIKHYECAVMDLEKIFSDLDIAKEKEKKNK